jgi:hypothetical protein
MHKLSIFAAAITAAITLAPIGAAHAAQFRTSPNYPTYPQGTTYSCTTELGHLRRVYEEELSGVRQAERVWVTPICIGEDVGPIRNEGNSGALRGRIAQNKAMKKALAAAKFRPEDVVGIRMMGGDAATLYVHPFNYY